MWYEPCFHHFLSLFSLKNVTRSQILWLKYTKFNFGWGSAPNPAEGAYDAPRDPLVGWGGGHPLPRLLPINVNRAAHFFAQLWHCLDK